MSPPPVIAVLSTLSLQTLDTLSFPSFSYRGAAGIYDRTLFAWNGYECNTSVVPQCTSSAQLINTSNMLHTLDLPELTLNTDIGDRRIEQASVSAASWQSQPALDPIFIDSLDGTGQWPAMSKGTSSPTYTSSAEFGWVVFPSGGAQRTNMALKGGVT